MAGTGGRGDTSSGAATQLEESVSRRDVTRPAAETPSQRQRLSMGLQHMPVCQINGKQAGAPDRQTDRQTGRQTETITSADVSCRGRT